MKYQYCIVSENIVSGQPRANDPQGAAESVLVVVVVVVRGNNGPQPISLQ